MKNTLVFSLILCTIFIATPSREQPVDVNDSLALVDLYNSTNGPLWDRNQNWLTSPVSTWEDVEVTGSRVTGINLQNNKMSGPLPASIGNLTGLTFLILNNNNLTGNIPASIGNLLKLTTLDLSVNKFTGQIPPSIGNLSKLTKLVLGSNQFTGQIPASIGNLVNVQWFILGYNQLSGSIPESIGNLASVTWLSLYNNKLTGSIPESIGNLTNALTIELNANLLTGSIPASIGNLKTLQNLHLQENQLSGSIPSSIGNLTSLVELRLDINKLTGSIPESIGNFKNLRDLILNDNQLTGSIPVSIGNLGRNFFNLSLRNNRLTGNPPVTIKKLKNLRIIDLSNNLLTDSGYIDLPLHNRLSIYGSLENNHFTFNTLEFVEKKFLNLRYGTQLNINMHQNGNTLSVSAGGKLSNNTYKWYKVGTATPTVITGDSTFIPSESGDYYAEITNAVATQLTLKTDTVSVNAFLAKNKQDQKLNIYPNPVNNVLTVTGFDKTHTSIITIADASGNIKLKAMAKQEATVQINTGSLKPGNYILYSAIGGKVVSVNFVKQ